MYKVARDKIVLVYFQGTILDQIDYNVEETATRVEKGLGHLQKAEKHQKKNKKMMIILILFAVTIVLVIILIATKGS